MEDAAADYFQAAKGEEREFLRVFSMINMLAFDVFARKMLIEKLIDRYFAEDPADKGKSKKKKKAAPSGQEGDS